MILLKSYIPPASCLIDINCSLLSGSNIEEGYIDYQRVFDDEGYLPNEAI